MTDPGGLELMVGVHACREAGDWAWFACDNGPGHWVWSQTQQAWFWQSSCWHYDTSESCHGDGEPLDPFDLAANGRIARGGGGGPTAPRDEAGAVRACGGLLLTRDYADAEVREIRSSTSVIVF